MSVVARYQHVVKMLLDKGADVSVASTGRRTSLESAAGGGHLEVVKLLLDKGADVKMQGGFYGNALQAASSGGHDQGIRGCPHSPSARIGAQGTGPKLELCFGGRVPKMELEGRSKNGVQKCEEDKIKGFKSGARSSDILVLVFTMFLRPFSSKDVIKLIGKAENAFRSESKSAAVH